MPETVTNCPLCGESRSRTFDQRGFRGQKVTNRLCLNCGLVYQSPRMTAVEADAFYAAEYRRMYQGKEDPIAKDLAVQRARAASLFEFTHGYIQHLSRHLDIGCSAGLLLQQFQEGYGCRPVGVEPGEAYRAHAHSRGLTVHSSLDELKKNETMPFDLVSLAHVLEHLPDPVSYLAGLRKTLLSPDGWLLIEVPNLYAHDSFETAHLFSFSAHTLAETVAGAGYKVVRLEAQGRPRSELVPYYLTLLARPRAHADVQGTVNVRPEKLVGIKRSYGLLRRRFLARLFPKKAWIELS